MFCSNCGSEVPVGAKFCPNCGTAATAATSTAGKITISRTSGKSASFTPAIIFIDGIRVGEVLDGGSYTHTAQAGKHNLEICLRNKVIGKKEIVIEAGKESKTSFHVNSAETPQPINSQSQSTRAQSQPTRAQPQPTRAQPQPISAQPQPISAQPQPTRAQPQPISAQPQPTRAQPQPISAQPQPISSQQVGYTPARHCPKCGGMMQIQTITEARKAGCLTVLLYILLSLTILGLLIVIPLVLRAKTKTVTYAVCQSCGYRKKIKKPGQRRPKL